MLYDPGSRKLNGSVNLDACKRHEPFNKHGQRMFKRVYKEYLVTNGLRSFPHVAPRPVDPPRSPLGSVERQSSPFPPVNEQQEPELDFGYAACPSSPHDQSQTFIAWEDPGTELAELPAATEPDLPACPELDDVLVWVSLAELGLAVVIFTQGGTIDTFLRDHSSELQLSGDELAQFERHKFYPAYALLAFCLMEALRQRYSTKLHNARLRRQYQYEMLA